MRRVVAENKGRSARQMHLHLVHLTDQVAVVASSAQATTHH